MVTQETVNVCWFCGEEITNPKYHIVENTMSYGVRSGTLKTVIHKKCYNEAKKEGIVHYFVGGLHEGDVF